MAHEATQTLAPPRVSAAVRAGVVAWAASRLAVLAVAVVAAGLAAGEGLGASNAAAFDRPALTHPFGGVGDALLSPLARWDAAWYLDIAAVGYPESDAARPAFFPLYPLLVRGVGELGGGSPGALLIAAYLVSLLALLAALVLLHRLTELELGRPVARSTLLLLTVFPASLFLGAPYSESLFLLCAVAAFLAARHDRFALAALAAAAASATRSAGVLLVVPLLLLYLYGPRGGRSVEEERARGSTRAEERGPSAAGAASAQRGRVGAWLRRLRPRYPARPDIAWLALAPAGLAAYALGLGLAHGDPLGFVSAQDLWGRELGGPLAGVWEGARAGAAGVWSLVAGARGDATASPIGDPTRIAAIDVALLVTLVLALVATAGVLRRLPLAYGAWIVAALALALSFPVTAQPLMSLPRFVVVLFPLFMWLALACERRRVTGAVAVGSAALLGVCVAQFAAWRFIA